MIVNERREKERRALITYGSNYIWSYHSSKPCVLTCTMYLNLIDSQTTSVVNIGYQTYLSNATGPWNELPKEPISSEK